MNEEITELYRNVEMLIENREGFGPNERELLRLDFESLSDHIDTLEDKVEQLEEKLESSYVIDTGDVILIAEKTMRRLLYTDEGEFIETEIYEDTYGKWVYDLAYELDLQLMKVSNGK